MWNHGSSEYFLLPIAVFLRVWLGWFVSLSPLNEQELVFAAYEEQFYLAQELKGFSVL